MTWGIFGGLIGTVAAIALFLHHHRRRHDREIRDDEPAPLLTTPHHPALRRFTRGRMPRHEDAPVTLREEVSWREITEREFAWVGDAIRGRREGEAR